MAFGLAVTPTAGVRTWTVVDASYRTVGPVEEWLEAHRHLWSPNTVRGYATSLAQWWSFLEQRGEVDNWREVGAPAVTGFLSWLRNGRRIEHHLVPLQTAPEVSTLEARLAAVVSFYRWQEAVFGVPVAGKLMRGTSRRMPTRGGCQMVCVSAVLVSERKIYEHGDRRSSAQRPRAVAGAG